MWISLSFDIPNNNPECLHIATRQTALIIIILNNKLSLGYYYSYLRTEKHSASGKISALHIHLPKCLMTNIINNKIITMWLMAHFAKTKQKDNNFSQLVCFIDIHIRVKLIMHILCAIEKLFGWYHSVVVVIVDSRQPSDSIRSMANFAEFVYFICACIPMSTLKCLNNSICLC